MKKILALTLLSVVLPIAASAATITNPLFSNGQTFIKVAPDSTVNGTFTLTVGANEEVEYMRTWVSGRPFTQEPVFYGEGSYTDVPFTVTAPPSTGNYTPKVQVAGYWGGNVAIDGDDNVIGGPTNLGTIRVAVDGGFTGGTTSSDNSLIAQLQAMVAALTAQVQALLTAQTPVVTVPAKPAYCPVPMAYNLLYTGMTGATVIAAQHFLLDNGFSIPALQWGGADFGFFGTQTAGALAQATASCN